MDGKKILIIVVVVILIAIHGVGLYIMEQNRKLVKAGTGMVTQQVMEEGAYAFDLPIEIAGEI